MRLGMAKKKAADSQVSASQSAAVARTQLLATRADELGVLRFNKPDEFPRLAPSKGTPIAMSRRHKRWQQAAADTRTTDNCICYYATSLVARRLAGRVWIRHCAAQRAPERKISVCVPWSDCTACCGAGRAVGHTLRTGLPPSSAVPRGAAGALQTVRHHHESKAQAAYAASDPKGGQTAGGRGRDRHSGGRLRGRLRQDRALFCRGVGGKGVRKPRGGAAACS